MYYRLCWSSYWVIISLAVKCWGIPRVLLWEYCLQQITVGSHFTTGLRSRIFGCESNRRKTSTIYHQHKHQVFDPLIRSVSTVTAARANASSVFQLFFFFAVCSGMISKGFGFVAFFAGVKDSSVSIHLSCASSGYTECVLRMDNQSFAEWVWW